MYKKLFMLFIFSAAALSCSSEGSKIVKVEATALKNVPAQRLNYRFETDVPAPTFNGKSVQSDERNEKVQVDFDQNRVQELLDRTITSPDKLKVLAVYRKINDLISEFRLDMYTSDGKLLKKITHEEMAVHFPGTIVWSPDSANVAFIAMVRGVEQDNPDGVKPDEKPTATPGVVSPDEESNSNTNAETNVTTEVDPLEPPKDVLTFRTEQIYICDSNGADTKPLTQNEGLMYFYAVWAPDSSALVALASPYTEWRIREFQASRAGEQFIPAGRPRLIETSGRERLLDDYPTAVHPVWSPDSAKIAVSFDKQIRIYDATTDAPTQAAIPLRNQLLLAARTYEEKLQKEEANSNVGGSENTNAGENSLDPKAESNSENGNANAEPDPRTTTLPDAKNLVAFNPIINLVWEQDSMLYLETGYVKTYVTNETENRSSFLRWHRLILSAQAIEIPAAPGQQ